MVREIAIENQDEQVTTFCKSDGDQLTCETYDTGGEFVYNRSDARKNHDRVEQFTVDRIRAVEKRAIVDKDLDRLGLADPKE